MRLLLIALVSMLLTATETWAGDPVPGLQVALELNAARPGEATGGRPSTRIEAVTDREGMAVFNADCCGWTSLFVTPRFEGEAILTVEGQDISVPIRGQGRSAEPVRAASFEVRRGEHVRVRLERPEGRR